MLLKAHLDAVEASLLAVSRVPANSGHSLHKGTPREAFIKEFLSNHLSERAAIGKGEVIDATSQPNQQRNQIDIVLYKREYPKLHLGADIDAFLIESLISTIEVKSLLTKEDLEQAVRAAHSVKSLRQTPFAGVKVGYQPPGVLSYVVAYDGPARIDTVYSWLDPVHSALGIELPTIGSTSVERSNIASPSLDGVFVLGKGLVLFDNSPLTFNLVNDAQRAQHPHIRWICANSLDGNLLGLFLLISLAVSGVTNTWFDPFPYVSGAVMSDIKAGP